MSPVKVKPSQVRDGDLVQVIGAGMTAVAGPPHPVGWSQAWACPVFEFATIGGVEPWRQPEELPVEVWRED